MVAYCQLLFLEFYILQSTLMALHATKNISFLLWTYNQSDIKQLGMVTVWLRHKDKDAKCRFFGVLYLSWGVVQPVLLGVVISLPTLVLTEYRQV